jgi:hypothetical protein
MMQIKASNPQPNIIVVCQQLLLMELAMQPVKTTLVSALIALSLVNSVLAAQDKVCLPNNRIWGWQAVNDRTIIITDRSYERYTVNLRGGCIGLDKYAGVQIGIVTKTRLGCLSAGDMVAFNSPGLGPLSCSVSGVRAGVPNSPPGPEAN